LVWLGIGALGGTAHAQNVEVVVNNALYSSGAVNAGLSQYLVDLQTQGYTPILTTNVFDTADALRAHLANTWATVGLAGAVFVGDQPVQHFECNGEFGNPNAYERFATDLYYEDLNGTWTDTNGNGTLDTHRSNAKAQADIWVGRLTAAPLSALHPGRTEASLLNAYFQKDHAYRQGALRVSTNGLTYLDDDWIDQTPVWSPALKTAITGTVTSVYDGSTTTAADFKRRLTTNQYEQVLMAVHSNATHHVWKVNGAWSDAVYNTDLAGLNPQTLFYNLFACSAGDYTTPGYLGGEYVFGTDTGLVAVASTKSGGMQDFDKFYGPLGQGAIFGDAMLNWWRSECGSASMADWLPGMTVIGDPTLMTQAYVSDLVPIPEPASMLLLIAGAGVIVARRRRCCPPTDRFAN
jgi:hypothetical protein